MHVWEHVGGWKFRESHELYYTYVDKWFHVKQTAPGDRGFGLDKCASFPSIGAKRSDEEED